MSTNYDYEIPLPGFFIQEELDAREWSQRDLAFILGVEETALNKIIKGKVGISLEMSKALAEAFGVDPDFFANLQKAYDLSRVPAADPAIARRASLQSLYPVREMIRRGWLRDGNVETLETELNTFLRADNDNGVRQIRHAARKTNVGEDASPAQLAWLYRVVQIAERMDSKPYSEKDLNNAQPKLKALMSRAEGVQEVASILADCGLRFVVVEGLQNGKIDGVCIWLDPNTPVVAMSIRFDRIDNFWFVLWHELAHVLDRHGKNESAWNIDVELEKNGAADNKKLNSQERKANEMAAEKCVPVHELLTFVAGRKFFSERDVTLMANRLRIHPGILVGQIQRQTDRWDLLRKHLVRVREFLMPTATVDGWGHVASLSS